VEKLAYYRLALGFRAKIKEAIRENNRYPIHPQQRIKQQCCSYKLFLRILEYCAAFVASTNLKASCLDRVRVKLGLAIELVWNSYALTPQEVTNTTNSSTQYCKRSLQVLLNNCNNVLCFLQDFSVFIYKEHLTAVVNLNTHLLQHYSVPTAT
jgi:hypothetical protein